VSQNDSCDRRADRSPEDASVKLGATFTEKRRLLVLAADGEPRNLI
jgi:hypothetical protein